MSGPVAGARDIRLLLVDDSVETLSLIRTAVRARGGFHVVGEASTGQDAVALVGATEPDVVLLDLGLPDLTGREVLTRIRLRAPLARVVIYSGARWSDRAWFERHSDAYVVKGADTGDLVDLLERVAVPQGDEEGLDLPQDLASIAEARRYVHDALHAREARELLDEAFLVVSELAANAVLHARTAYRVGVSVTPSVVRIRVRDSGPGTPEPRPGGLAAESGRGLLIVAALASSWGIDASEAGFKTVWADIARHRGPPETPASRT